MDLMERPAMRRLVRDLKRHAPLLALGVMAIVVLVSAAVVIGASRQTPHRDAGLIALASPSPRPSATPSMTPAPTPSITPTPDATPPTPGRTPEPTDEGIEVDTDPVDEGEEYYDEEPIDVEDPGFMLEPGINLLIDGMEDGAGFYIRTGATVEAVLQFPTRDLDDSACSLTQSYEPDDPEGTPWTVSLEPVPVQSISMADGQHTFVADCPSSVGELTARVRANVMDRKPEACRDFEFVRGEISVGSFEELAAGVVGTWKGCVTTPWTPMYEVTVTLREDGTYSAASTEVLDGTDMVAMYWGMDEDHSAKLYAINDFQASQLGIGQIDVVFGYEPGVRDELRNVRLMGDQLEFELVHLGQYGPITFQLYRQ